MNTAQVKGRPRPTSLDRVFYGSIAVEGSAGPQPAYLKVLSQDELIRQVIGHAAAGRIGLPVPQGYVASWGENRLPSQHGEMARGADGQYLVFAWLPHWHNYVLKADEGAISTVRASAAADQDNAVMEVTRTHLGKWPEISRVICFDQWLANKDRRPESFVAADDGLYVLIDHRAALFNAPPTQLPRRVHECCGPALLSIAEPRPDPEAIKSASTAIQAKLANNSAAIQATKDAQAALGNAFDGRDKVDIRSFLNDRTAIMPGMMERLVAP